MHPRPHMLHTAAAVLYNTYNQVLVVGPEEYRRASFRELSPGLSDRDGQVASFIVHMDSPPVLECDAHLPGQESADPPSQRRSLWQLGVCS